jgi:uncharacterized protein YbjT (DUF2867 family)
MNVLLKATGVTNLDRSVVAALLTRSHRVRVVPEPDRAELGSLSNVEIWTDDIAYDSQAARAVEGMEVIIDPCGLAPSFGASPHTDRTHRLIDAAANGHIQRFVYVASRWQEATPAADEEVRAAEAAVRRLSGRWLLIRADEIYGVSKDRISRFLQMMRTLPAVPIVAHDTALRPVWHEDLATAVAASVDAGDAVLESVLEVSGPEDVTAEQLYDRLATLIERRPLRIRFPEFVTNYATAGFDWPTTPVTDATSGADASGNEALPIVGLTATGLSEGLGLLIESANEQTPSEGVGTLEVKQFWADIKDRTTRPRHC